MASGTIRLRPVWDWWLARLAECVPGRLRGGAGREAGIVLQAVAGQDGGIAALEALRRGAPAEMLPAAGSALRDAAGLWRGQPVLLRIPDALVLRRHIVLPLAAEQDVDGVLGFEMDRLTPFSADQVAWRAAILRRDRAQGRLQVDLALVPRTLIHPIAEALNQAGARLEGVELGSAGAVRLAPGRAAPRRLRRLAWSACAVLALAVLALPFIRQSLALDAVQGRIATLQPRLAEVDRLRQQVEHNAAGGDAVASERAHDGDALELVAQLTAALPDDTYLTDLSLEDGHLRISGQSDSAARLIALLAATPALRAPSFAAPVTRNDRLNVDLFTIQLNAAGAGT